MPTSTQTCKYEHPARFIKHHRRNEPEFEKTRLRPPNDKLSSTGASFMTALERSWDTHGLHPPRERLVVDFVDPRDGHRFSAAGDVLAGPLSLPPAQPRGHVGEVAERRRQQPRALDLVLHDGDVVRRFPWQDKAGGRRRRAFGTEPVSFRFS